MRKKSNVMKAQKIISINMDAKSLVMLFWNVTLLIFVQIIVASASAKSSTEIAIRNAGELSSVIMNAKILVIRIALPVIDLAPRNVHTRFVPENVVRFVSNV